MTCRKHYTTTPALFIPAGSSTEYRVNARKRLDEWGLTRVCIVPVTGLPGATLGGFPSVETDDCDPIDEAIEAFHAKGAA